MKALLACAPLAVVVGCSAAKPRAVAQESTSSLPMPPLPSSPQAADSVATRMAEPDSAAADSATVARLERRARGLAHTRGCTRAGDCRVAPLGARACGGPRDYVAYCAASTDTAALFAALRELERVERAYNQREHVMGSCQMERPPAATLARGRCGPARTP